MFNNVYKNKTIFITGHTGFKGSWLSLWLLKLGANVVGYSLKPMTTPNLFSILNLKNRIKHIVGDVRDRKKLLKNLQAHKPDMVFHLAAQALVRDSYDDPTLTYETNVLGTLNLFEAIRQVSSIKAVVNVTTDKVYDNKEKDEGYKENEPLGGYDPYSSSKACSEIVTASYRSSFFNPNDYGTKHHVAIATARAGNVIGGGDWAKDRLLPDIVRSLSQKQDLVLRNPQSTRPWQYVLEPLSGYLLLGSLLYQRNIAYSGAWNFGPKNSDVVTVEKLVKKVIKIWGEGHYVIKKDKRKHEAKLLKLNIFNAMRRLHWSPRYNSQTAITETIEWYKKYYNKKTDMYEYSMEQLNKYRRRS